MGPVEIEIHIFWRRNFMGRRRYDIRIVDLENGQTLMTSNQRYSRLIDASRTAQKIARYACTASIKEVGNN